MVKITYKGETRNIPKSYLEGLKGDDRKKQIKSIFEGTIRPETDFKSKKSKHIINFEKKYNKKITDKKWINDNILTYKGQKLIMDKGYGAYFSGGSRPNQTPQSWALSRLASVITGGGARKVDKKIWDKFKKI